MNTKTKISLLICVALLLVAAAAPVAALACPGEGPENHARPDANYGGGDKTGVENVKGNGTDYHNCWDGVVP